MYLSQNYFHAQHERFNKHQSYPTHYYLCQNTTYPKPIQFSFTWQIKLVFIVQLSAYTIYSQLSALFKIPFIWCSTHFPWKNQLLDICMHSKPYLRQYTWWYQTNEKEKLGYLFWTLIQLESNQVVGTASAYFDYCKPQECFFPSIGIPFERRKLDILTVERPDATASHAPSQDSFVAKEIER